MRRRTDDAPDHVTAAFELARAVLAGRVELEVRGGLLALHATSYLIDEGQRTRFTRSGTLRLGRRTATERVRFDFGTTGR